MKSIRTAAVVAICVLAAWGLTLAQEDVPGHEHAPEATSKPVTTAPTRVLATVGTTEIMSTEMDRILRSAPPGTPPERLAAEKERILQQMIQMELISAYLEPLPCSDEELAAMKKEMADELKSSGIAVEQFMKMKGLTEADLKKQLKISRIQKDATSKEKVAAFRQNSPTSYFDGTSVRASHILIDCKAYASKAVKAKARAKLEKIAGEILTGKVKFEDAASKHSACPSKAKGGDLGPFTFERMAPPFSQAAFALKVGQVSGVVETSFGYHLIKATDRTEGSGKPGPTADAVAANVLLSSLYADIFAKSAEKNPVVIK